MFIYVSYILYVLFICENSRICRKMNNNVGVFRRRLKAAKRAQWPSLQTATMILIRHRWRRINIRPSRIHRPILRQNPLRTNVTKVRNDPEARSNS
jgi:hypothetical protein